MPKKSPKQPRRAKKANGKEAVPNVRQGSVDAFAAEKPQGPPADPLERTGTPPTVLVEQIQEGAFLQRLQDDERRRIARELHDTVGQLLVALAINTSAIKKEAHKLSPEGARIVDENAGMIDEIGKQIRAVSHFLHPPLLDEVGLPSAIRWYVDGFAQSSNIQVSIDIPDDLARLPPQMEIGIFRAVQECLTNIHRHSGSSSCAIAIAQDEKGVHVEVRDSGRGLQEGKQLNMLSGGLGLRVLQERIRLLGGSVEIRSSERGTTVILHLPTPGPPNGSQLESVA